MLAFGNDLIRYIPALKEGERNTYYFNQLQNALKLSTSEFGPYQLQAINLNLHRQDAVKALAKNQHIDIVINMTTDDLEKKLRPVRVPLLKGLLGHRIFIVRKKDKDRFMTVTLKDLKTMRLGQGAGWADTEILKSNGFNVTTSKFYHALFLMLTTGRIEYFPRGLPEPWQEVSQYGGSVLTIDEYNMLIYLSPIYFFVNNSNLRLAKRLEVGFEKAIENGSFETIFLGNLPTRSLIEKSFFDRRKIFYLNNPTLPRIIPKADKYWIPSVQKLIKMRAQL